MKTQKGVVGKWDRHSQLVYFGKHSGGIKMNNGKDYNYNRKGMAS